MTWFVLSLIAMFFWSGSDFFSKLGSKPDDTYSHWKMVMAVGLVMGIHAFVMIGTGTPFSFDAVITYMPASFCYILSMIFGYVGLRYIELSISSPVCNSSGAVAAVLCAVFLGQRMLPYQLLGVILITVGIVLLQKIDMGLDEERKLADSKYKRSAKAIIFPLLYCAIDGLGTFVDALILDGGMLPEETANVAYELTFLGMAVFAFIYVVIIRKQKLFASRREFTKREIPKLLGACSETAGQFAYIFAIGANAVLAAPMIAAYCMLSMVWSRIFLKEKLTRNQYIVIGVAIAGIILLGIGDA